MLSALEAFVCQHTSDWEPIPFAILSFSGRKETEKKVRRLAFTVKKRSVHSYPSVSH